MMQIRGHDCDEMPLSDVAAGLSDHEWSIEELVGLLEDKEASS